MEKKTISAREMFGKNAQLYQEKYMDVSKYSLSIETFSKNLPNTSSKILELACGPGNLTKLLLQTSPTVDVLATDITPTMLSLAKENNPAISTLQLDMNDLSPIKDQFDGILCGFGLPYLSKSEVKKLIENVYPILYNQGLLYVSTMSDNYDKSGLYGPSSGGDEVVQMYFHPADELSKMIKESGFEILFEDWPDGRSEEEGKGDVIFIGRKI